MYLIFFGFKNIESLVAIPAFSACDPVITFANYKYWKEHSLSLSVSLADFGSVASAS